jgi:hypothetical protein
MFISKYVPFFNWTLGGLLFLSPLPCQHPIVKLEKPFNTNNLYEYLSRGEHKKTSMSMQMSSRHFYTLPSNNSKALDVFRLIF